MLTTQQESYFETFGFLMMKQYFSAPEMEEISRQFDSVLNKDRNGDPFKGKGQQATTIVEQSPFFFTQLVVSDRIYKVIE